MTQKILPKFQESTLVSIEKERIEELRGNQCMSTSTVSLKDHKQIKKNSWRSYVVQA
jgi:hypothetical protein